MGMCVEMCVGVCMGVCMGMCVGDVGMCVGDVGMCVGDVGMCVGDVCGRVYGHVWQCEGMSGCYYCIYMSHIFARQLSK